MQITRMSVLTGVERTMDLPITEEQWHSYTHGTPIQDAFPDLDASQREFIMTGMTHEEWSEAFPPEDCKHDSVSYQLVGGQPIAICKICGDSWRA